MGCMRWCASIWNWIPSPGTCSSSPVGGGIKPHSAYRLGFVIVEYRWHPLHGKRVRLLRRTVHGGTSVVHVDIRGGISSELPAWMVDASVCSGMELGRPEVSLAALNDLRSVLTAASAGSVSNPVSSLHKEGGSGEKAATKTLQSTVAAITGLQNTAEPHRSKREGGND